MADLSKFSGGGIAGAGPGDAIDPRVRDAFRAFDTDGEHGGEGESEAEAEAGG